ncbi:hypothetical protein FGO68_gene15715 [Halteria grandinella]|uniref:Uncharacterized protein n=1 Tax=Halteria grandinella TaxID=5974 RepID=A0A8J8NV11_HALGN|nr:hypothetical protein FGO68_gene15715 [Halteria grandinella]
MKYFRRYLLDRHLQSHHQLSLKIINPDDSVHDDQSSSSTSWISYSSMHGQSITTAADELQPVTPKCSSKTLIQVEQVPNFAGFEQFGTKTSNIRAIQCSQDSQIGNQGQFVNNSHMTSQQSATLEPASIMLIGSNQIINENMGPLMTVPYYNQQQAGSNSDDWLLLYTDAAANGAFFDLYTFLNRTQ